LELKTPVKSRKVDYRYDLVQVVWDDAHSLAAWEEDTDAPLEPCHILTIGFLIREDEKYIKVADSYVIDGTDFSGTTQIPKGMLIDVKVLKKKATK
jgi:hypothetical protein